MPEKVKELSALIDEFLVDTGATFRGPTRPTIHRLRRQIERSCGTRRVMIRLRAWKERGCKAVHPRAFALMTGTSKSGAAFLGRGMARLSGPAVVKLKVRSSVGGAGKIECYPKGAADPAAVRRAIPTLET